MRLSKLDHGYCILCTIFLEVFALSHIALSYYLRIRERRRFGIKYPIIQGGMVHLSRAPLVG
jgi:hypothetical protein